MSFRMAESIHLQVANFICRKILLKEWKPGDKMPGIHELGILLEVNPRTAEKALEYLNDKRIFDKEHGVVSEKAPKEALSLMRENFMNGDIPALAEKMKLLDITVSDLNAALNNQSEGNK